MKTNLEIMKEKIEKEIKELEELYDYYLEKTEDPYYNYQQKYFEDRLHDLRVEIKTYKKVLEMLENEYGTSYTRLEELHDFVVEQDLKHINKGE